MASTPLYVTAEDIRAVFNRGRFAERFQAGEFQWKVTRVGPSPPNAPRGGYSQMVRYYVTEGGARRTVAVVHQRSGDDYGNPLGGDRPDPKRVVHDGVDYRFSPNAVALDPG